MATDPQIDPASTTTEPVPPSSSETQPAQAATESVEELKAKLAAAESEANTWKGRAEKLTKAEKSTKAPPVSEEDIDWKLKNNSRVDLVKDTYQKHLDDLQSQGAKLSNQLRDAALQLAESETGVTKPVVEPSEPSLPTPSVNRSGTSMPKFTEHDVAFGVKAETKKKYGDYVEGR